MPLIQTSRGGKVRIVPSILTDRVEQLRETLKSAERFTDYVQIDFMDGVFVPSKSVSPKEMHDIQTPLSCEAHLMVEKPKKYLDDLTSFGFTRIIFHYEADSNPRTIIEAIKGQGIQAGMAINPETGVSRLNELVSELDSVLFLSVNPGFYGSAFIPSVLEKIQRFRSMYPSIETGIDGGIALDNVSRIRALRVSYACVGSRIFLSEDPVASYREFEKKVMNSKNSKSLG